MSAGTLEKVNAGYQEQLNDWIEQEKATIDLISTIGKLWFEKSIELVLFRNQLVDRSASEIMKLHMYAKDIVKKPINVKDTVLLAREIYNAPNICASKIDIGKLAFEWYNEKDKHKSAADFINLKLRFYKSKAKHYTKRCGVVWFWPYRSFSCARNYCTSG